jgi:hypothetical protein
MRLNALFWIVYKLEKFNYFIVAALKISLGANSLYLALQFIQYGFLTY